jgi:N-acetyl-alpha-D-muramate 1-phosphate uridylyltransferase
VLAAGRGERLRPLTDTIPKALLPINNVPLVDLAIERLRPHVDEVAVNAHYLHEQLESHLAGRGVHVSVEQPEALGTAGALGALHDWIDGRDVLLTNCDAWYSEPTPNLVDDGQRMRLLVVKGARRADYGEWLYAGTAYLPWNDVRQMPNTPAGLHEVCWREAWASDRLDVVPFSGQFIDCGTPADYEAAQRAATDG